MPLHRRDVIAGSGALLAACATRTHLEASTTASRLDAVLEANAQVLPELAGVGANHYPMAAEVLEALGQSQRIEDSWRTGAASYRAPTKQPAPIADLQAALGQRSRHADWCAHFERELASRPWRSVVADWTARLSPGVSAAVFHGVIRTAHAVRALERVESETRKLELAAALAYWASSYVELPPAESRLALDAPLNSLPHRWLDQTDDVPFDEVHARLARAPIAPHVDVNMLDRAAQAEFDAQIRAASEAFLEMLVLERHRIWLLHGVTGPAAAALLSRLLDEHAARVLAAYSRQASVALFVAFGAPFTPRAHLRESTASWTELLERACASRSVHTLKLVEVLHRHRSVDDALCRSVAAQWFEWT